MSLLRYRDLPRDEARRSPLDVYGAVHAGRLGSWWTVPVFVPLAELAGLRAVVMDRNRMTSVRQARLDGVGLPPIEVSVHPDGSAWIVDGNHRLVDARRSRQPGIWATFTFVGAPAPGRQRRRPAR
jgi:hypothetical protein